MDVFEWSPTECAEQKFPMQIIRGDFYFKDHPSVYIPKKTIVKNGWGEIGSIHIVGEPIKPIPLKLKLTWFSFAENKFYYGDFDLPLRRLKELFQTGFFSPITKKTSTYRRILVGMALEGGVSLWTAGDGIVRHVEDFVANESSGNWSEIFDNESITREEYIASVMERALGVEQYAELRSVGLPNDHWKRIMSQYSWEFQTPGVDLIRVWIKTLNGELEFHDYENGQDQIAERKKRACPITFRIDWRSANCKYYSTDVFLDAAKTFVLFKRMSSESSDEKMTLQIEMNPMKHAADAILRTSRFFVPLEVSFCRTYHS